MKIADLLTMVRFYLDEEVAGDLPNAAINPFWNDTKLTLLINRSYAAFREMLSMYDKDYGLTTVTGSVTIPGSTIALPADFRAVNQLNVNGMVLSHTPMTLLLRRGYNIGDTGTPVYYYITGTALGLWPKTATALPYTLIYTPGIVPTAYHPPAGEYDTELDYPERDTWLRWVVYDVVAEALKKDRRHDEAMAFVSYRREVEAGIDRDVSMMNRGTVKSIFGEQ